jgi:hypothetical protein
MAQVAPDPGDGNPRVPNEPKESGWDRAATNRRQSTKNLSVLDLVKMKTKSKSKWSSLKDNRIPWYIIDPTGDQIKEQREIVRQMKTFGEHETRKGLAWAVSKVPPPPPLYPGWDMVTALALVFTALVTPFEVGFLPPPASGSEPLFIINRIVDAVFILDMISQFFTMYEKDTTNVTTDRRATFEMRLKPIAINYLTGWFTIDIVSVLTCLFDIIPLTTGASSPRAAGTLRTIRVLRLVKLVRLMKASKVMAGLASRISLSNFSRTIMRLLCKLFIATHYYACVLAILGSADPLKSWMATYGFCEPDMDAPDPSIADPICVDDPAYMYLQCVCWGLGLIIGFSWKPLFNGPYSPYYDLDRPNPGAFLSSFEQVAVLIMKTIGIMMWTLIFSALIRAVSFSDPEAVKYNQDVDKLNTFCVHNNLPGVMRREFRRYLSETRKARQADARTMVLKSLLSPKLMLDAAK